ncbi:MAG: hypothetical protein D8M57_02915 [Candidatus Scalindua sp. AMX11]|nr:MAG: hypothetical protein DWQ00_17075 [Candidatus Scalindua sp.]NOG85814.1 hypothetical protein [Planctomycetota bacterium]RZV97012.1 MAG: hypothetical protein EX341_02155 [Candidatus Scalindua sp. SCAELEC01]TDE66376.1 MAG: hypothetical protein D8M57_02915 [Candidatus Scalindua sp. AMX11]GJQ58233.1 MAG: hypothetical protein SCALA701_10340 [Candidatus Scalindua sp.]
MEIPLALDSGVIMKNERLENSQTVLKDMNKSKSSFEMRNATQNFEAIMVNMLVQAMWKTIPKSDLFEKNSASGIYEGITLNALSDEIAKGGGFGIADMLNKQMRKE